MPLDNPFPAIQGTSRWNNLRDSLPFTGTVAFALAHCIFLPDGQIPMRETTVPKGVLSDLRNGRTCVDGRRTRIDRMTRPYQILLLA